MPPADGTKLGCKRFPRTGTINRTQQYGAIPVRVEHGRIEVLLVTSRGSGRWIIPKGWAARKLSAAESAAREAFEEAGVRGIILPGAPIGFYVTPKRLQVGVFVLHVTKVLAAWPEARERQRRWFAPDAAAVAVDEAELAALFREAAAMLLASA